MARKYGSAKIMRPNNESGSLMSEDFSQPALLPRGVREIEVSLSSNQHRAGRLGDLYAQVNKTTAADQAAFDKLTDPHNW
jgi:hypothetical protein